MATQQEIKDMEELVEIELRKDIDAEIETYNTNKTEGNNNVRNNNR